MVAVQRRRLRTAERRALDRLLTVVRGECSCDVAVAGAASAGQSYRAKGGEVVTCAATTAATSEGQCRLGDKFKDCSEMIDCSEMNERIVWGWTDGTQCKCS